MLDKSGGVPTAECSGTHAALSFWKTRKMKPLVEVGPEGSSCSLQLTFYGEKVSSC